MSQVLLSEDKVVLQSCTIKSEEEKWGLPKDSQNLDLIFKQEQIISAGCWRLCSNMWCQCPAAVAGCLAGSVWFFPEHSRAVVDQLKWQSEIPHWWQLEFWAKDCRTAHNSVPPSNSEFAEIYGKTQTRFLGLVFCRNLLFLILEGRFNYRCDNGLV